MSEQYRGRAALVTGAAQGIGRACAIKLATHGADLILNDCAHAEEIQVFASEIQKMGRRALVYSADIADTQATSAMFADAIQTFGRLDILVNNAAWSVRKPFLEHTAEEAQRTFAVTLWGSFHAAQLAAKQMVKQRGGSIVMITSSHAIRPYPNASAYNAAKAALHHLTASLALELAPQNIRVNAVEPGWIDTPGEHHHNTEAEILQRSQMLPMLRLGTADEIADAVAYLCSEDASYITGSTLRVDGGFALRF